MILANYIQDLLYRYDCVIVPNFGGFVTNKIGAKINSDSHTFYPPTKQVTFNAHLKHNDGLLANYIVATEKITFEKATEKITSTVNAWQQKLKSETVSIKNIGSFSLNEKQQIIFNPKTSVNYLTDAFGLHTFNATTIQRNRQKVVPIIPVKKSNAPVFFRYAAAAVVFIGLSVVGWNFNEQHQQEKFYADQSKAIEEKIQNATFVISNPLPTIELNVVKETPKAYHIIAGAFRFRENAAKKVRQLQSKGFNAEIVGVNKWGLTQVAFKSYETRKEAYADLSKIRKTVAKDAWLLVKRF